MFNGSPKPQENVQTFDEGALQLCTSPLFQILLHTNPSLLAIWTTHGPSNKNSHLTYPHLTLSVTVLPTWMPFFSFCLSKCRQSFSDGVISIHWPERFLISPKGGIFPRLWSLVALHSCIKQRANYLQSNNRMKGGMVDLNINYILLEQKELQMWDDNIDGKCN